MKENDNEKLNAIQTQSHTGLHSSYILDAIGKLYGIYREPNAISQNVINHKEDT